MFVVAAYGCVGNDEMGLRLRMAGGVNVVDMIGIAEGRGGREDDGDMDGLTKGLMQGGRVTSAVRWMMTTGTVVDDDMSMMMRRTFIIRPLPSLPPRPLPPL